MEFELTEDQAMLRDSIRRLVAREYTFRRQQAPDFGAGAVRGFEERLPALKRVLARDQPPHAVTQDGLVCGEFKFHG